MASPSPASPARGRALARDLSALLGAGAISAEPAQLRAAAGDDWTRLSLRARGGQPPALPEVVAWPRDAGEVARLVAWAAERQIPVVPVGGRSGAQGGAVPMRGGVALSLARLSGPPRIDLPARVADVEAGLTGRRLIEALAARASTLGHAPEDLESATIGGWMATRSASAASCRFGAIEDLVLSLEAVDGTGQLVRTLEAPTAGLDLKQLLLGSEGTLCVFTGARLRIFPAPRARWTRAVRYSSMARGLEGLHRVLRAGLRPSLVALVDPLEALLEPRHGVARLPGPLRWLAEAGSTEAARLVLRAPRLLNTLVDALPGGPVLVLAFEELGPRAEEDAEDQGKEALRACAGPGTGGEDLGAEAGGRWLERRGPGRRREALAQAGAFVESVDVATTWDRAAALELAVRRAAQPHALVLTRFASPALEGCALDVTLVGLGGPTAAEGSEAADEARDDLRAAEQRHEAAVQAVLAAAADAGATLSHHRGVGLQRQLLLPREHGEGMRQLRALKRAFDPHGILNPGKLLL